MGGPTLGIDFGTTTTLAARQAGPSSSTIPIGDSRSWMPTLVATDDGGHLVVGERAEAWPERAVVRSVKSYLLNGTRSVPVVTTSGAQITLDVEEIIGAVLGEVAQRLERSSGIHLEDRPRVRFGCPALWTARPRHRLAALADKAGFDLHVSDILDEPIAAGVSWVMNRFAAGQPVPRGRVLVFDCGGGTLDVAVLEVRDGSAPEITVLSAAGIGEAGDALDAAIADDLSVDLRAAGYPIDEHDRAPELGRLLRLAANRLKEQLTVRTSAETDIGGEFHTYPTLRYERTRLETVLAPQLDRALRVVYGCLRAAELRRRNAGDAREIRAGNNAALAREVTFVLLVGGMSRVPAVAGRLSGEFPNARVEVDPGVRSPEESVVNGLTYDDVVSELNLHRPAFDFVVEFLGSDGSVLGKQELYPAYHPLYSPDEVARGGFLLGWPAEAAAPAGATEARLSCVGVDGRELELHVDGQRQPGLTTPIGGRRRVEFKLYVDGTVLFRGTSQRRLRVERWPVLRSTVPPAIRFRTIRPDADDQRVEGWWHGGE